MIWFSDWNVTAGIERWSLQGEFDISVELEPRLFPSPPRKLFCVREVEGPTTDH